MTPPYKVYFSKIKKISNIFSISEKGAIQTLSDFLWGEFATVSLYNTLGRGEKGSTKVSRDIF